MIFLGGGLGYSQEGVQEEVKEVYDIRVIGGMRWEGGFRLHILKIRTVNGAF